MALKDVFGKIFKKDNSTDIVSVDERTVAPLTSDAFPVVSLSAGELSKYKKLTFAGLAAIGTAFSGLPESARTITQTVTRSVATEQPLYVAVNPKGVEGFLQQGRFGINGNVMQVNANGQSVIAGRLEFVQHGNALPVTETTTTVLPPDPTLMIVAVALMTIEKKLDTIDQRIEEVLHF